VLCADRAGRASRVRADEGGDGDELARGRRAGRDVRVSREARTDVDGAIAESDESRRREGMRQAPAPGTALERSGGEYRRGTVGSTVPSGFTIPTSRASSLHSRISMGCLSRVRVPSLLLFTYRSCFPRQGTFREVSVSPPERRV